MFLRFIYVDNAVLIHSFSLLYSIPLNELIYSSLEKHPHYFLFLAMISTTTSIPNMSPYACVTRASLDCVPKVDLLCDLHFCDIVRLNQFTLTLAVDKSLCCSVSLTPLNIIGLTKFSNQINVKRCLLVVLISISLITRKVEYLLTISQISSLLIIAKSCLCLLLYYIVTLYH